MRVVGSVVRGPPPSTMCLIACGRGVLSQVPFRTAHGLAGKAVAVAEEKGCSLADLTLENYQEIHPSFEADVADVWNFENSTDQ